MTTWWDKRVNIQAWMKEAITVNTSAVYCLFLTLTHTHAGPSLGCWEGTESLILAVQDAVSIDKAYSGYMSACGCPLQDMRWMNASCLTLVLISLPHTHRPNTLTLTKKKGTWVYFLKALLFITAAAEPNCVLTSGGIWKVTAIIFHHNVLLSYLSDFEVLCSPQACSHEPIHCR